MRGRKLPSNGPRKWPIVHRVNNVFRLQGKSQRSTKISSIKEKLCQSQQSVKFDLGNGRSLCRMGYGEYSGDAIHPWSGRVRVYRIIAGSSFAAATYEFTDLAAYARAPTQR